MDDVQDILCIVIVNAISSHTFFKWQFQVINNSLTQPETETLSPWYN